MDLMPQDANTNPLAAVNQESAPAGGSPRRRLVLGTALGMGLVAILTVAIAGAFFAWQTAQTERRATQLLQDLQTLQVGDSPFDRVVDLAGQFPANSLCVGSQCAFQFENRVLEHLHLAPATEFHVIVSRDGFRVGQLTMAMLVVGKTLDDPARARAQVFERAADPAHPAYSAVVTRNLAGESASVLVAISPQATPGQRQAAFQFNLHCLSKIGGCQSSSELMPVASRQATQVDWVE